MENIESSWNILMDINFEILHLKKFNLANLKKLNKLKYLLWRILKINILPYVV